MFNHNTTAELSSKIYSVCIIEKTKQNSKSWTVDVPEL